MVLEGIRELMYREHRFRVNNAISKIDSKPPHIHMGQILRTHTLKDDAVHYQRIMKHNRQLMITINEMFRTQGRIKTFEKCQACELQRSKLPYEICLMEKIQNANFDLGRRLLDVKGTLNTRTTDHRKEKQQRTKKREKFVVPNKILKKYDNLRIPSDSNMLRNLLRPTVFFDLAIANICSLGRLVIQLYTEACPQVVLEFVRFCHDNSVEQLQFVHLFPKLWLGGVLPYEGKELNKPKIEYDMRALDHGMTGGILSFSSQFLKGFRNGFINFAISFRPLSALNGKHVGFGLVKNGNKLLTRIQEYGSKTGKPRRKIVLTNCGVI